MRRQVRAALGPVRARSSRPAREPRVPSSAARSLPREPSPGRDVEVASRPGDSPNVSRDDLVFPRGKIHIVNTSQPPMGSMNPQTCAGTVRIKQITKVRGGTGRFRHASGTFAGTLRGWGVAARKPDGTCEQQAELLLEVDVISMQGTLSF